MVVVKVKVMVMVMMMMMMMMMIVVVRVVIRIVIRLNDYLSGLPKPTLTSKAHLFSEKMLISCQSDSTITAIDCNHQKTHQKSQNLSQPSCESFSSHL